jgi:mono/diheme cytochrome c family protein
VELLPIKKERPPLVTSRQWLLLLAVAIVVAGISFTIGWRPILGPRARPLTNRTFEWSAARVARGKYLAETVSTCMDCHSPRDWTKHDTPMVPGMEGAGQDFGFLKGLPGHLIAPNLTPDRETGAGNWGDDAIARAIREGIGHDGRTIFPLMPYEDFRHLSDEDVASIVVFLRSLPPVRNPLPATQIDFPVKYLMRSGPRPLEGPVDPPDMSTSEKRGEYLVQAAACEDCHTPRYHGQALASMNFAGGSVLEGPWGRVAGANITPDASGIGYYDEALFTQTMRTGLVRARQLNQIMPWPFYRDMTDEDLHATFAYLKTLKPVRHRVDNTEPPTLCKLCKAAHGLGAENSPAH